MTLEQLRMLKMVAELGSLKEASQVLHKTQPAISQGIKQLESQLKIELFSRQGYRLTLTEAGQHIYVRALRLLNEASEIEQLSSHLARGVEASVTLALEAGFDLSRLLPILENAQQAFPDTSIIIRQEYMSGAREAVLQQKSDLAISHCHQYILESEEITGNKICQGILVNVAAPRLLARHPNLKDVSELRHEYQIVVQDSGQATRGKEFGVQQGQRRWYVNDYHSKKALILSGMGWGKLPDHLIKDELKQKRLNKVIVTGVQNEVIGDYYVLKHKNTVMGPVATALWQDLSLLGKQEK